MKRIWTTIKATIMTLIIVFSLLIIVSSLNIGGRRMFAVRSGSMEPAIHTGSIVISKKYSDYAVGDTITFKPENTTETVTHRITKVETDANKNVFYTVKGDANDAPDSELVSRETVVGKVIVTIPLIGYLVAFVKTLPGLLCFIIVPATLVIYDEITNIHTEIARLRAAKKKVIEEVEKVEEEIEKDVKKVEEVIEKEVKQIEKREKKVIKDIKGSHEA